MQKFSLVMLLLVTSSMVFNDAFATQIQIVTDLGNVFTVQKTSLSNGTNGSSIAGAGLGTVARIQTVQPQGTLVYGSGYIGTTTPIQPYVSIPQGTNFAALIQNNDNSVSLPMPEFYATYDYINGRLVQEPGPANILSFTDTKMLSGNLSPTLSTNGIQITGNPSGTMVLKLNSLAGRQVVLRGTIPSGDNLQYVLADSSIDLTNMPYDGTNGWHLATTPTSFSYSGYYPTYSWTCGYVHPYPRYPWYYYWTCWQYQSGSYPTAVSASAPLDFTVSSQTGLVAQLSATYAHTCSYHYGGKGWGGYRSYTCYSTVTYPASISGYQTANGFHVTGVSYTDSNYNGVTTGLSSGTFVIYDKTPYSQLLNLASNFEQTYTFPNDNRQLYLISTQPNANTIIASAQPYDPNTFSYLKIKGVPPNIPYEIVKNNMVGVTGLSPSDGSAMTFQVSDIGLQARGDSPGGT
ncbi:MAG: hypothetical protein KGL95_14930, partial [Patescibacteria group bacterium]|nr:hypothetical protein [Patescibacteria group bacterium]